MKKISRNQLMVRKYIKETIEIVIGCLLMAAGTSLFLLPNQLSSGGFAGISTIVYYLFGLPLGTTMLILNIPLMILTIIRVGKETAYQRYYWYNCVICIYRYSRKIWSLTEDRLLACIYGGILIGLGTAIVLKANASTGGTDLLTYIICSYKLIIGQAI